MPNNEQTKIFIASSIVEFERERDIIENYLWRQNCGGDIKTVPLRCENVDPAMSVTRKEDDYFSYIAESDVCLFILGERVGKYTVEEYDCARELIKSGKKLRVIAFCKGVKTDPIYKKLGQDKTESYDFTDDDSLINLLRNCLQLPEEPSAGGGARGKFRLHIPGVLFEGGRERTAPHRKFYLAHESGIYA